MMPITISCILEVSSKRATAIISINRGELEVLECTNSTTCRIQGVLSVNCPRFCPFIVDAKRYARGLKPKNKVEVLSRLA